MQGLIYREIRWGVSLRNRHQNGNRAERSVGTLLHMVWRKKALHHLMSMIQSQSSLEKGREGNWPWHLVLHIACIIRRPWLDAEPRSLNGPCVSHQGGEGEPYWFLIDMSQILATVSTKQYHWVSCRTRGLGGWSNRWNLGEDFRDLAPCCSSNVWSWTYFPKSPLFLQCRCYLKRTLEEYVKSWLSFRGWIASRVLSGGMALRAWGKRWPTGLRYIQEPICKRSWAFILHKSAKKGRSPSLLFRLPQSIQTCVCCRISWLFGRHSRKNAIHGSSRCSVQSLAYTFWSTRRCNHYTTHLGFTFFKFWFLEWHRRWLPDRRMRGRRETKLETGVQ